MQRQLLPKRRKDDRRRHTYPFCWWWCCCGLMSCAALASAIVITVVFVTNRQNANLITVPTTTATTTTTTVSTTSPSILPCTCNLTEAIDFSVISPYDISDGKCIAGHPNGIYFFTGLDSGSFPPQGIENMIVIDPDTLVYGTNLLPTGYYPADADEITACVYYPVTGEFLVTDYNTDNLYSINPNGVNGTVVGVYTSLPGNTRGFALVNGTRLFGITTGATNLYEFDLDTGMLLGMPVPLTFENTSTPVFSNGVTWDSFSQQMFIIYTAPGDNNNARSIGVVDPFTGIVTRTCVLEKRSYASLAFDAMGRFWVMTGNAGANPRTLYTLAGAPCVVY